MNMRFTVFAAALAAAGAAVGIYQGSAAPAALAAASGAPWRDAALPIDYSKSSDQFLHTLEKTGVFLIPKKADAAAPVVAADPITTFPVILSVAVIDGKTNAILRNPDGSRIPATSGAELPNGWKVISVNLKEIVAEREGKTYKFDVYKRTGTQN